MRSIRIVVDALAARFGGTAYAALHTSQSLAEHPEVASVVVVTRAGSLVAESLEGIPTTLLAPAGRGELARRLVWEATALPRLVSRLDADVLLTFSGMLPRSVPCTVVSHLSNPVMLECGGVGNHLRRWAVQRTADRGARLVSPSNQMADLVERHIGRRPALVPHGVDHETFRPGSSVGTEILCVADFYPHKCHWLVIAAWQALPPPRPRLRLVGNPAAEPSHHASVVSRVAALRSEGEIILQSGLTLAELAEVYRRARVFVMASKHESFCMPAAEALASGVPVLARDLPALRETAGPGAHYLRGDDSSRWGQALRELMLDDRLHARLRSEGLQHAARYSWPAAAQKILAEAGV